LKGFVNRSFSCENDYANELTERTTQII